MFITLGLCVVAEDALDAFLRTSYLTEPQKLESTVTLLPEFETLGVQEPKTQDPALIVEEL